MTVEEAKELATFFHEGQVRADGVTPYITHPAAVAKLVEEKFGSDEMICIAWLHDVIEEAEAKVAEKYGYEANSKLQFYKTMRDIWDSGIAFGVSRLSDTWRGDNFAIKSRGKLAYLCDLLVTTNADIVLIKLCDMLANIRESNGTRMDQEKRYVDAVNVLRLTRRQDLDERHDSLMTEIEALYNIHKAVGFKVNQN